MDKKKLIPFEATHPGILIQDELDCSENLTQKELALQMDVKPSYLNEIIKGKRPITADIAILLEKIFGISADYWMRMQSQYEIDCAKIKEKNIERVKLIEIWKIIKQYVPITIFSKKGYLSGGLSDKIASVFSIYSVTNLDGLINKISERKLAFFKKSTKLQIDEKNMAGWTSLAEYEALNKNTNTFHFENIPRLNDELKKIFYKNQNTIEEVDKKLAQYGIKFVIIEKFEKTPIDGYSFWSNNNPVIAITLRLNKLDNLAFTIFHEIGHIVLHLRNDRAKHFLDIDKLPENSFEEEANDYAKECLISKTIWENFIADSSNFNDEKIIEFSKQNGVNPAIVFGRFCYEKNNFKVFTSINKKIQ